MMTNLYVEIMNDLQTYGYYVENIEWIGFFDGTAFDVEEFLEKAKNIDYDSGYGSAEINPQLVIVMCDGTWFYREEYDGSEWFAHAVPPTFSFWAGSVENADFYEPTYYEFFIDRQED